MWCSGAVVQAMRICADNGIQVLKKHNYKLDAACDA